MYYVCTSLGSLCDQRPNPTCLKFQKKFDFLIGILFWLQQKKQYRPKIEARSVCRRFFCRPLFRRRLSDDTFFNDEFFRRRLSDDRDYSTTVFSTTVFLTTVLSTMGFFDHRFFRRRPIFELAATPQTTVIFSSSMEITRRLWRSSRFKNPPRSIFGQ